MPGAGETFAENSQASIQGGTWYFYNQRLRAAGISEFTTKYGNRKLEDNWRRSDKALTGDFGDGNTNTADSESGSRKEKILPANLRVRNVRNT